MRGNSLCTARADAGGQGSRDAKKLGGTSGSGAGMNFDPPEILERKAPRERVGGKSLRCGKSSFVNTGDQSRRPLK